MPDADHEPIAIIGMGLRFPGCENPDEFWKILVDGRDMTSDVPPDRFSMARWGTDSKAKLRTFSTRGAFIDNIRDFDAPFFNLSPKEASQMDPQVRLLLEASYNAIEDAGVVISDANRDCGVYIGHMTQDYLDIQCRDASTLTSHAMQGNAITMAANRISFFLDVHGPSLVVDTACSSSLVAMNYAIDDLRRGKCSWSLAGGCSALLDPRYFVGFTDWGILSPDGRCFSFDARGNGYVRGEGTAMLVLKRLSDARAAGDNVYAVIDNIGVNHDGKKRAITSPNGDAHMELMRQVYSDAKIDVTSVDYMECHGTGTAVGDVTETNALRQVLCPPTRERPLVIGSVKTNFGHLEGCAGIIGVMKAALSLYHSSIPRSLNFEIPNPKIPFEEWKLRVPVRTENWPKKTGVRRASVNSFGIGGTNAHVILESYDEKSSVAAAPSSVSTPSSLSTDRYFVTISAHRKDVLQVLAKRYQGLWSANKADPQKLSDLCYTLMFKRAMHPYRLCVSGGVEDVEAILKEVGEKGSSKLAQEGIALEDSERPVGLVFCGQGAQWNGMGMDLYKSEPVFKRVLDACCAVVDKVAGYSLLAMIQSEDVNGTRISQPSTTAIQLSLLELYRSWGLKVHSVIGHSSGEIAAVYAAGAITLEEAMLLAYYRGSTITDYAPHNGCMAAVAMTGEEAAEVCKTVKGVRVACYNSPSSITISGDQEGIDALEKSFAESGQFFRKLKVTHAFHSHHMEAAMVHYREAVKQIKPKSALTVSFFSSLREAEVTDGSLFTCDYFVENLTHPVGFCKALQQMVARTPELMLLEIGPHSALRGPILQTVPEAMSARVLASLVRGKAGVACCSEGLGGLLANGAVLSAGLHTAVPDAHFYIGLPTYPYVRQELWLESEESFNHRCQDPTDPLLGLRLVSRDPSYQSSIELRTLSFLVDHRIMGSILAPGAMYLEMAMAAALDSWKSKEVCLYNAKFLQALILPSEEVLVLRTNLNLQTGEVSIGRMAAADEEHVDGVWMEYFRCFAKKQADTWCQCDVMDEIPMADLRCKVATPGEAVYAALAQNGLNFGPTFQTMKLLKQGVQEGLVELELKVPQSEQDKYTLHPTLIDALFQCMISSMVGSQAAFLPTSIGMISYQKAAYLPGKIYAYVKQDRCDDKLSGSVWLYSSGVPFLWARECTLTRMSTQGERAQVLHRVISDIKYEELSVVNPACSTLPASLTLALLGNPARHSPLNSALLASPLKAQVHVVGSASELSAAKSASAYVFIAEDESIPANCPAKVNEVLDYVHELIQQSSSGSETPFYIVTVGAQAESTNSSFSGLLGFGRALQSENPNVHCALIDLDGHQTPSYNLGCLFDLLSRNLVKEGEVLVRGGYLYSPRVEMREKVTCTYKHACPERWRMDIEKHGLLDSFVLREDDNVRPLLADEVRVDAYVCGLSYKDVMVAMGMLKEDAFKNGKTKTSIGLECSGIVREVGSAVKDVVPGDRVMTVMNHGISPFTIGVDHLTYKIPPNVSMSQAAGLYVPYSTAYVCLIYKANVQKGEIVLVHGASGGVGSCAVQLAVWRGATVIATASTPAKKEYCLKMGATYVFDSRSTSFSQDVLKVTEGHGCDVILNSLSDKMMTESVRLLAEYGRFVEIGKVDAINDNKLNIHDFLENGSYFFFDIDRYFLKRPAFCKQLGVELCDLLERGVLKTPPVKEYTIEQAGEAFRFLAMSKHIGKLTIRVREESGVLKPASMPFKPQNYFIGLKTHLILGSRGLGMSLFQWMASRGGRHFILVSKSGKLDAPAELLVDTWRRQGCVVKVAGVDVSDQAAFHGVLDSLLADMPPLSGVLNCTMFLQDMLLARMDAEKFHLSCDPKSLGSYNAHLYESKLATPYEYFVCFSSISSVIGNRGQANYCAGNSYMESLMSLRRAQGLRGAVLNLGGVSDVGAVARNSGILSKSLKDEMITSAQVLEALSLLFDNPTERQLVVDHIGAGVLSQVGELPKFKFFRVMKNRGAAGGASHSESQSATHMAVALTLAGDERTKYVEKTTKETVARVLGLQANTLRNEQALSAIGIDSIVSVELSNWVKEQYGLTVSVFDLTSGKTIAGLVENILEAVQNSLQVAASAGVEGGESELGRFWSLEEVVARPAADISGVVFTEASAPGGGAASSVALQAGSGGAAVAEGPVLFDWSKTKEYNDYSQYMKVLTWNPYFFTQEKISPSKSNVDEYKNCVNFTMYDYLGFNFDEGVHVDVKKVIDTYGTSAGASRLAGGQIPIHEELEKELASFYGVPACLVMLGGHTTNVNAIKALCGPRDLVLVDELSHNSIMEGASYSGATRMSFQHNDPADLERKLIKTKGKYDKTLITIEGTYSMDGDIPDLAEFIRVKSKHNAVLMVDEAHSIGVLGETGRGISEHFHIDPNTVDIWMGSLGKAFSSAGGYIAGSTEMVTLLRWRAPGFVYSIGLPPPAAASALYSLKTFKREPERVMKLRGNIHFFQDECKKAGIEIGKCYGGDSAVVPVFVGETARCLRVLQDLRKEGVLVAPGMWPACEANKARLRFFITAVHTREELSHTVEALKKVL